VAAIETEHAIRSKNRLIFSGAGQTNQAEATIMKITQQPFGQTRDGVAVTLYTLTNDNGLEANITNYGGIIVSLFAPDQAGNRADVVHGFDSLDGYLGKHPFFGCAVGRFANRIAGGKFTLNGVEYTLALNNGPNHLHGGLQGFDKKVWASQPFEQAGAVGLTMRYRSPDGEEGYPGNLDVTMVYTLTAQNELKIEYTAAADQSTIINLTNHTYFNLAGKGDILGHQLMINADYFTPVNENLIPTGELRAVAGTPHDFSQLTAIGNRINQADEQLQRAGGYDHSYVLNARGNLAVLSARVVEPGSGRVLEMYATQPAVQLYTGNFLDGSLTGKGGRVYHKRSAFCLETQHYPDSPNQPDFPSTVLNPGQEYHHTTVYKFGVL
jgi:aldose 1-epimerase